MGDVTLHDLRVWPEYWDDIDDGVKNFEVRRDDRGFNVGDMLLLREWDQRAGYSGRECSRNITYIYRYTESHPYPGGLEPGFCVLGLEPPR